MFPIPPPCFAHNPADIIPILLLLALPHVLFLLGIGTVLPPVLYHEHRVAAIILNIIGFSLAAILIYFILRICTEAQSTGASVLCGVAALAICAAVEATTIALLRRRDRRRAQVPPLPPPPPSPRP